MICSYLLTFAISALFVATDAERACTGTNCDKEEPGLGHGKEKYYKKKPEEKYDWNVLLENIVNANRGFRECRGAECYIEQIQSDFEYWDIKGRIDREDFLHAKEKQLGEWYQIIDNKLYRQHHCIYPKRCEGNEYFINKIVHMLPDMEFIINTHYLPKVPKNNTPSPVFSFSKTLEERDILYPAWSFWKGGPVVGPAYPSGIGRWDVMMHNLTRASWKTPWEDKEKKAYFRGSRVKSYRDRLIHMSWTDGRWTNAFFTKIPWFDGIDDTLRLPPAEETTFEEHCPHKYLVNFDGYSASFRFRHLFLCKSLVFHVSHGSSEFFYRAMRPWVHYIPVPSHLDDIRGLIDFCKKEDTVVKRIAERGQKFVESNLKMEDITNYWLAILLRYVDLVNWTPQLDQRLMEVKPISYPKFNL